MSTKRKTSQPGSDLKEASAQRLFELIRMCHPNEKGEPYGRFEVLEEIERRGWKTMLIDLDIPVNLEHIWKNRYTGDECSLKDIITSDGYRQDASPDRQIAFALENWNPIETWEDSAMHDDYKKKLFPEKYDKNSLLFYDKT